MLLGGAAAAWRIGSIWLAVVVGSLYILSAKLSLSLLTPEGWPAAGVAAGVLIAFWPRARSGVIIGMMVATRLRR
jgi:hypothetical protein